MSSDGRSSRGVAPRPGATRRSCCAVESRSHRSSLPPALATKSTESAGSPRRRPEVICSPPSDEPPSSRSVFPRSTRQKRTPWWIWRPPSAGTTPCSSPASSRAAKASGGRPGGVVQAAGSPHTWKHRVSREARHGIDLVDHDAALVCDEDVHPGQALAADRFERSHCQRPHLFSDGRLDLSRYVELNLLGSKILRPVVVEAGIVSHPNLGDLAGHRPPTVERLQHPALQLTSTDEAVLDNYLRIESTSLFDGCLQLVGALDSGDSQTRAATGRLDEYREMQRRARVQARHLVANPFAWRDGHERTDRQPGRGEHQFHVVLVHADRAGQHTSADVAGPHHLEQTLNGAILTERAVQQRQGDIDRT